MTGELKALNPQAEQAVRRLADAVRVDDEYLWNEGDFVSVIVPEDAMEFKLLDARGKGGDKG